MITITERACNKIKDFSDGEGLGYYIMHIRIIGGGCAGYGYDMQLDNNISETDEVFKFGDISVVIDALSLTYLEGSEIDFVENEMSGGFKVLNPNVDKTCGCGSSFSMGE